MTQVKTGDIWLHNPNGESKLVTPNTAESTRLQDSGEWYKSKVDAKASLLREADDDLEEMEISELKRVARERGIEFLPNAKRPTMLKLLRGEE